MCCYTLCSLLAITAAVRIDLPRGASTSRPETQRSRHDRSRAPRSSDARTQTTTATAQRIASAPLRSAAASSRWFSCVSLSLSLCVCMCFSNDARRNSVCGGRNRSNVIRASSRRHLSVSLACDPSLWFRGTRAWQLTLAAVLRDSPSTKHHGEHRGVRQEPAEPRARHHARSGLLLLLHAGAGALAPRIGPRCGSVAACRRVAAPR